MLMKQLYIAIRFFYVLNQITLGEDCQVVYAPPANTKSECLTKTKARLQAMSPYPYLIIQIEPQNKDDTDTNCLIPWTYKFIAGVVAGNLPIINLVGY